MDDTTATVLYCPSMPEFEEMDMDSSKHAKDLWEGSVEFMDDETDKAFETPPPPLTHTLATAAALSGPPWDVWTGHNLALQPRPAASPLPDSRVEASPLPPGHRRRQSTALAASSTSRETTQRPLVAASWARSRERTPPPARRAARDCCAKRADGARD